MTTIERPAVRAAMDHNDTAADSAETQASEASTEGPGDANPTAAGSGKTEGSKNIRQGINKQGPKKGPKKLDLVRKKRAKRVTSKRSGTAITKRTKKAKSQKSDGDGKDGKDGKEQKLPDKPSMSHFCTTFKTKPPESTTKGQEATKKKSQPKSTQQQQSSTNEETEEAAPAGPAVQIINGEIVLQESSMILHGNVKPPTEDDEEYQVVEEEDQLGGIGSTYTSFSKKRKGSVRWTAQETEIFYQALRQVGTDFTTMESFFNGRSQKTLKRKYKQESTRNPELVEAALNPNARKKVDLSVFEVTESDVANIKKPEPPADLGPAPEKEGTAGDGTQKDNNDSNVVVEEDANDEIEVVDETDEAPQQPKVSDLGDSFWNDGNNQAQEENNEASKPAQPEEIDPALEDDVADTAEEAAQSISLLSRASAPKKKPKFKAAKFRRKGKGK